MGLVWKESNNLEGQNMQEAVGAAGLYALFRGLASLQCGALAKLDAVIHNRRAGGDRRLSIPCDR
jgi:hypothetical protein